MFAGTIHIKGEPGMLQNHTLYQRAVAYTFVALIIALASSVAAQEPADTSVTGLLKADAAKLKPLVTSEVAQKFLDAVADLPKPSPRVLYVQPETRTVIKPAEYEKLSDSVKATYKKRDYDEYFYYYTRYGTPLAFVRALDLTANAGLTTLDGAKIIDFGFGSVGQLRLMASLGAEAVGIEVDPVFKQYYTEPGDTGEMPKATTSTPTHSGQVRMLFGQFPADSAIKAGVGIGYDAFISKNTLKRGYIHPAREVDPRMLVHLGVDDSTYVTTVYDLLKPGGLFMIYNLCPAEAHPDSAYIPWANGRCPFDRGLMERTGFTVLEYDKVDDTFARTMGATLGWGEQMDLEKDLFCWYTLVRK